MSSFCFAMSDDVIKNLDMCTEKENHYLWESSIEFLTQLVNDEKTSNVDKMHYLRRLKIISQISHDVTSYIEYGKKINELCKSCPECKQEYISYYGSIY